MFQAKKGSSGSFGMKAHIGLDTASGSLRSMATTPAYVNDLTMAGALLHSDEGSAFGDPRCQSPSSRPPQHRRVSRCADVRKEVALRIPAALAP